MSDLLTLAREWADGDPDPVTRAELEDLIERGDVETMAPLFEPELTFGTAGIRGRVGPGPGRMNRAVVIRTTYGLATYLLRRGGGSVVVGFDARPDSERFAADAVTVLAAAGLRVVRFDKPTPTPLVAFTAKHLSASGAVVITASHNPPEDNGYKVYGGNAAQIIPPVDTRIAELIRMAPPANQILEEVSQGGQIVDAPSDIFEIYRREVDQIRPRPVSSELKIVYTPLHGCGGETLARLLQGAGHRGLIPVMEQFTPDGRFPTVGFPNPEEEGALDLAVAAARRADADLVIANDPDADRLAAVLPRGGEWYPLSGNDLGCLLGDFVMENWSGDTTQIVVSSIVSSPMLSRLAALRGARHELSLTGFKWIVNAGLSLEAAGEGTFTFGYEEALGYTIGQVVRDKDGMSAALVLCDLVENLRLQGRTLWDRLISLWSSVGIWASAQRSVASRAEETPGLVDNLANNPPAEIAGLSVERVIDYRVGEESRPPWLGAQDLVELSLGGAGRALARPSGTEPKVKIYVDLSEPMGEDPLAAQITLAKRAGVAAATLGGYLTR